MKHITLDELRRMTDKEGLILQGCGGDPEEWVTGINELLTNEGILLDGDTFQDVAAFQHGGLTNLLFNMNDVKLNIGKLTMWRLQSHSAFGGTWLSDYVPNRLGGFVKTESFEKELPAGRLIPDAPLLGADGNIFNILGIAANTLKQHGMREEANEMRQRVTASGSYDNALCIIMEYVNPVSADDEVEGKDYTEEYDEPEEYDEDEDQGMAMM